MAFDQNKYKAIFEARYGSGSFESGLSKARQIGASKVQADLAMSALKKQRTAATKKTYDDALNYWNDPANKESLLGRGAHNIENDYLNDPREKARVKELGFTKEDYIDAMYSASTNGAARSKREKKQQEKKRDFNVSDEKQSLIPMLNNKTAKPSTKSEKKVTAPSKKETPSKKKTGTNLWDDLKNDFVMMGQKINPFDDVSWNEAQKIRDSKGSTKFQNELKRGTQRALDSASLGIVSNLEKKETGKAQDYTKTREFGEGGGTDMLTSGLGYLAPGVGMYKGLNATKTGKALTQFGSKGIGQRLATEGAKGAIIGAGMSGAEVGTREGLNPNDYNWKQNLGYIGMNTALGSVADPLLYGAGKGLTKGFETASSRTMQNLLPSSGQVEEALKGAAKSTQADNALPIARPNVMNDLIPRGNDITNPSFVPSLTPRPKPQVTAPNVGNQNPLTPLNETSVLDRASMFENAERPLPDFSYGRQTSEPNPPVNVYGAEVPFDKVQHAPADYWRNRYEEFAKHVNQNYDSNNLNKEALDDLWTQFAKYDEPVTLDEVVDLAYKNTNDKVLNATDVWDKMGNRQPATKQAKNILMGVKPKTRTAPPSQNLLPDVNENRPISKPLQQVESPLNSNTATQPAKPVEQPLNTSQVPKQSGERSFYSTVQNPDKLSPEMEQLLNDFDKSYKPMSNEETVKFANKYVEKDIEKAYQFVKNARKFDPRHVTVGHRLIDELQKAGQYDRALDVVERLAEQGTKAGQSIQSFSIYNRLSAEGQLLRAQRRITKVNEAITDPNKQVKLTPQNMEDITHTADSIQKFSGQMEQANNVMKIMEQVKKGKVATDGELETIRSFVGDAKKFFGDLDPAAAPKVPRPVKDVRTRDKVVDFMSKREEVAKKELQKIFGRANSLPVDAFYHLSVIGASKMAKGTIKLADFTEEMVKEFGEQVRPYAKQIYNKAAETFNLQSESMTRQRLSEVEKITNKALKDKNLSADEAEEIREFARQVGVMSGDAKLESSMELQTILQSYERPSFGQKLSTAQTISQLLNPKTVVRNALGNEMFYRFEQMNKLLATPVDIARSKITGGERTVTFISNNQGQYWQNWLTGAKAGWKGVNPMGLTTAYDLGPQAFRSKANPLTWFEKSLGATLRSFDHAGYMRAYNKTLGELATLRAVNEGLKGQTKKEAIARYIREADENIIQIADQYGKYATFQDNTALSNGLQKVKRAMNFKKDFGLGDMVLKYPKTPGNLVMRALEYSPAGVLRSAYLMKHAIKGTKPLATREATEAFTRAIIGTGGFSLMGYALADLGILTGSGSSDYELASLEKSAGKQANSLNVNALWRYVTSGFDSKQTAPVQGDTFISYDWAQPIAIAAALGVGVNKSVKENEEINPLSATKGAFDGASSTVLEMSVLSGLKDFLTSYPGKKPSDYLVNPAKNIVSSFIPTLSNQVRQVSDNSAKTTYSPNLLPEIGNKAINRIPGANKLLPPAYDTLGNQRKNFQNDSNNLFNVLLNPSFVSKYEPSAEAEFVLNAINETGDKNLAPRMAQKKLDGEALTSEQYAEMQRIMGEEVKSGLSKILYMEGGNQEELSKAIEKVLREAGKTAREAIRAERGE
jgi:hypothetical protein